MRSLGAAMAGGNSATGRKKDDFYATVDLDVTRALLSRYKFGNRTIHECACGTGEMAEVIKSFGYHVVSTDLVNRGYGMGGLNFLEIANPMAPVVITNPPFKLAAEFVQHGMEELKLDAMALLLKSTWTHGMRRAAQFEALTPILKLDLTWRPDFSGQGAPTMEFSWFIWKRGFKGNTTLKLLHRPKASR